MAVARCLNTMGHWLSSVEEKCISHYGFVMGELNVEVRLLAVGESMYEVHTRAALVADEMPK